MLNPNKFVILPLYSPSSCGRHSNIYDILTLVLLDAPLIYPIKIIASIAKFFNYTQNNNGFFLVSYYGKLVNLNPPCFLYLCLVPVRNHILKKVVRARGKREYRRKVGKNVKLLRISVDDSWPATFENRVVVSSDSAVSISLEPPNAIDPICQATIPKINALILKELFVSDSRSGKCKRANLK